jgi:hypothetical protein
VARPKRSGLQKKNPKMNGRGVQREGGKLQKQSHPRHNRQWRCRTRKAVKQPQKTGQHPPPTPRRGTALQFRRKTTDNQQTAEMQAALKTLVTGTEGDVQSWLILVVVLVFLAVERIFLAVERRAKAQAAERRAKAQAAERRAEAQAASAEAALCYINVRRWDGHTSAMVKLRLSFAHFRAEALGAVRVKGQARLYTVRGDRWQERQPLTDAPYEALLRSAQDEGGELADVLVFQPMLGADASPDKAPVDAQEVPPRDALAAQARGGTEASSGRSSTIQSMFRANIVKRDGNACVLCRGTSSPLEAAHVLPRTAGPALLHKAGLMDANETLNGILLCTPCHRLYDAFMWCHDPTTGVVVADALLHDAALGKAWGSRVGAQLRKPDEAVWALYWPPTSVWAASLCLFHDARTRRHAKADAAPFPCSVCGDRWVLLRGLTHHTCRGAKASATFHTPIALRKRASGGGGAGEVALRMS